VTAVTPGKKRAARKPPSALLNEGDQTSGEMAAGAPPTRLLRTTVALYGA
jgi:hypothetical protein